MAELPPNHHADYPTFSGMFGYVAGLTMTVGRGKDARLVADLAELGPTDHVLDVGCGPGTAVRIAARRGARVTGVDPSEPMLRLARVITRVRKPGAEIDWVRAGAEDLTLPDDSVTVCWSLAAVHHWPQLDEGIAEVHRVLRAGALFIALEKRTEPLAEGNASHGWTDDQAVLFASMLEDFGFTEPAVANHELGKRKVVVVTARK